MSVATTSKEAYEGIKTKLGTKQLIVYEAIKEMGTATNEDIATYLGWEINRVTGRVTELHRYDMIVIEGMGKNKSGFSAKLWAVKDLNDRKLAQLTLDCGV